MADFRALIQGCGGTALRWGQGRFLGNQTFGSGGVCGPLALMWIKDRRHNINFAGDLHNNQEAREEVMQLKLNQHRQPLDYAAEYLRTFGLNRHFDHSFHGELSLKALLDIICAGPGYYMVGISDRGLVDRFSGHAIAFDMFSMKFFDPNFGQASFANEANLRKGFTTLFRLEYLDMHGDAFVTRYF